MKNFLLDILADPYSLDELKYNNDYLVNEKTGKNYPVKNTIANFVINDNNNEKQPQEFIKEFGTEFNYTSHYEKDSIFYDYLKDEDSLTTRNERKRSRQSIINNVPNNAEIILDIGCGGGWVAEHFLPLDKKVVSMDISPINPQKVLNKFPHTNHAAVVADAYHLPFKNKSFDCIIASEVIEHLIDPLQFVKILSEKVKPGGKIILITPYNEKREFNICIHCNKPTPKNAHLHSFNENNIQNFDLNKKMIVNSTAFNNKYATRLRFYDTISLLPFKIWRLIDKAINAIIKKPTTLLIQITKASD